MRKLLSAAGLVAAVVALSSSAPAAITRTTPSDKTVRKSPIARLLTEMQSEHDRFKKVRAKMTRPDEAAVRLWLYERTAARIKAAFGRDPDPEAVRRAQESLAVARAILDKYDPRK